jgi:hypothetical protein
MAVFNFRFVLSKTKTMNNLKLKIANEFDLLSAKEQLLEILHLKIVTETLGEMVFGSHSKVVGLDKSNNFVEIMYENYSLVLILEEAFFIAEYERYTNNNKVHFVTFYEKFVGLLPEGYWDILYIPLAKFKETLLSKMGGTTKELIQRWRC